MEGESAKRKDFCVARILKKSLLLQISIFHFSVISRELLFEFFSNFFFFFILKMKFSLYPFVFLSYISIFCLCCILFFFSHHLFVSSSDLSRYEGKVVKGNRNALYLIEDGKKRLFPDFNTYSKMGFEATTIAKITDKDLESIPLGKPITPIPIFRPEDRMYHSHCEDPDRLVNDLSIVPNLGSLSRFANVYSRIKKTGKVDILFLGGSITAGGYFMEFIKTLSNQKNLSISYHNHGHGATEITCKLQSSP